MLLIKKLLFSGVVFYFLIGFSSAQTYQWAATDSLSNYGSSIAMDDSKNLFVTQAYSGGICIRKLNTNHQEIWKRNIICINISAGKIETDGLGNIYLTGRYIGDLTIDSIVYNWSGGGWAMLLVKYNSHGEFQWIKKTSGGYCSGRAISTDGSNNIYVAGTISEDVYFDSILVSSPVHYLYIVKYNTNGKLLWIKHSSGTSVSGWGMGMQTDVSGNSYLTGNFQTYPIYFDSIAVSPFGYEDIYLAKIDSSGNWIWIKHAGGIGQDAPADGLSLDGKGNLYISGFLGSPSSTFGNFTVTGTIEDDYFLAKYDTSGKALWVVTDPAPGSQFASGVCADKKGVYLCKTGTFLLRYDSNGNYLWEENKAASIMAMLSDKNGVYITGGFSNQISFGSFILNANNNNQMYIARLQNPAIYPIDANIIRDNVLQEPLNVSEAQECAGLVIYPNPAVNQTTVSFSSVNSKDQCALRMFNAFGQNISSEKMTPAAFPKQIAIGTLPKGIYFIEVAQGSERAVRKLILQ